jgi:thiamine biosynthesis lipoprotein
MKQTEIIMGMPITVEIVDSPDPEIFNRVFDYFRQVDEKFSTYKDTSEISKINRGEISILDASLEMREVFDLCEKTKQETNGFFDIRKPDGTFDPSGLVKGWAIKNAAEILKESGVKVFYVEAGGDVQAEGKVWTVGIKSPFKQEEVVKVLKVENAGVATSGTYMRGQHIYNPKGNLDNNIVSITVIGPNIYESDRFATAAFAMGREGIMFIEKLKGFEGYMIDKAGLGTETSGFTNFL